MSDYDFLKTYRYTQAHSDERTRESIGIHFFFLKRLLICLSFLSSTEQNDKKTVQLGSN